MLAKDYGFKVYAADLWSEPHANCRFFYEMGLTPEQITPVKADATDLPFEKDFSMQLLVRIPITFGGVTQNI